MSREHKFRGLRLDNGKKIEGNLIIHISEAGEGLLHSYIEEIPSHWNTKDADLERTERHFWEHRRWEVDPATVGEFTGLKDSKRTEEFPDGQEIYEGDIVQSVSLKTWVCEWEGIGFDPFVANMEHSGDGWHYEVIGDIHTTPELLKTGL